MITGAIALLFGIVSFVAAENGEWGTFGVGVAIAVLAVVVGIVSREDDRAQVNFMHYWATGERPERSAVSKKRGKTFEQYQAERGLTEVNGEWTAGTVQEKQDTTFACRVCGGVMDEIHRVRYTSGTVYVTYKCRKCGRTTPVKLI